MEYVNEVGILVRRFLFLRLFRKEFCVVFFYVLVFIGWLWVIFFGKVFRRDLIVV